MKKKWIFIGIGALVVIAAAILCFFFLGNKVTVKFNTDGAKEISAVKVKKGSSITLPTVEKEGYELDGWYLGEEKVTSETTFDKDVALTAKWAQKETPTEEPTTTTTTTKKTTTTTTTTTRKKEYTCPSGYDLEGTKCVSQTASTKVTESCETGWSYSQDRGLCYKTTDKVKVCPKWSGFDGKLLTGGIHYQYCAYNEQSAYNGNKSACESNGYDFVSTKCYSKVLENNAVTQCPSGYVERPAGWAGPSQTEATCINTKSTIRTCPVNTTQNGNSCYPTIDATLK